MRKLFVQRGTKDYKYMLDMRVIEKRRFWNLRENNGNWIESSIFLKSVYKIFEAYNNCQPFYNYINRNRIVYVMGKDILIENDNAVWVLLLKLSM